MKGKTAVIFFPESSIRTRVSFEKGIYLLGGQTILFPPETLDKREDIRDVCGYLNNWADIVIVRHKDMGLLEKMAEYLEVPLINAMRKDISGDKYLFVGQCGNIGLTWKEASEVLGFSLAQCCGKGYEIPGLPVSYDIMEAAKGKDIICTDALSASALEAFRSCQVTAEVMSLANEGALLDPCPPFYRGEEVSADAIDSEHFVGYGFKKSLLEVQQAVIVKLLSGENHI